MINYNMVFNLYSFNTLSWLLFTTLLWSIQFPGWQNFPERYKVELLWDTSWVTSWGTTYHGPFIMWFLLQCFPKKFSGRLYHQLTESPSSWFGCITEEGENLSPLIPKSICKLFLNANILNTIFLSHSPVVI